MSILDQNAPASPEATGGTGGALGAIRPHLAFAFVFTAVVNVLFLSSPLYMMQLYGRVLNSRSLETLVSISIALALALVLMGAADAARGRLLARAAGRVARRLAGPAARQALADGRGQVGPALDDVETVRKFLGGGALATLMDTPFTLLFLFVLFLLHPMLGLVASLGAVVILTAIWLSRLTEVRRERRIAERSRVIDRVSATLSDDRGEIRALELADGLAARLGAEKLGLGSLQLASGDLGASVGAATRTLRLAAHSAALATGAVLAIDGQLMPSAMLAAAILAGRALGPIEALPGALRHARLARTAMASLEQRLDRAAPATGAGPARQTRGASVDVRRLVVVPAGASRAALRSVSFRIKAGEAISVAGPSGAGKSTLLRCLAGADPVRSGEVRIGGVDIGDAGGGAIGWMPQDAPVYPGTVRDNIARFGDASDAEVREAAQRAGVIEAIERLPRGFATPLEAGSVSPALRQAVAFARALLRNPTLVLLDQPTSHMDAAGEVAVLNAIRALRSEGVTVMVVSHKPVLATLADRIMLMQDGAIEVFEERERVLGAIRRQSLRAVDQQPDAAGAGK